VHARDMNPTKHDLPEATRAKVVDMLNVALATALDLTLATKQAHWNVKGPQFFSLHALFDQVYEAAADWSDELAERAVQLGGTAQGTLQAVAKHSLLDVYPPATSAGHDHLKLLAKALAKFGASVRHAIDAAAKAGDADTADLFTEISRGNDKQLWFIEAHLE
jgi:starvation-inducible DNA-binding protein